ncbi:MAG: hypothetical protein NC099_03425 [Corallococcus sp.]|nr:hypothetical protein [Bacillota bacterium]MCM1533684.1 hypothetical protein [Corallococcus sp.]
MKKITYLLCLIFICACLSCCTPPLGEREIEPNESKTFTVYVSGAVEHDGYFTAESGSSLYAILSQAGILEESVLPSDSPSVINGDVEIIIVDFYADGARHSSVNVNGEDVILRLPNEYVSRQVIDKLACYIERNGAISNRDELEEALGDDYGDNYYKFFIDETDYA